MSLINEALQRANAARPARPADEAQLPAMRPVVSAPRPVLGPLLGLAMGLLAGGGLAAWLLSCGWQSLREERTQREVHVVAARTVPTPPAAPTALAAPTAPTAPIPPAPKAGPKPAEKPFASVSNPAPAVPPAVAPGVAGPVHPAMAGVGTATEQVAAPPPPNPAPAPFKLQAIFYRPGRSSVLINSQMLTLGEWVGDARVVAIHRATVILVQRGQTNVLTLR
ncbi:MAG: hypothetical protein JXQ71_14100 [Verrucomicrobia bacterium]|nr:hypothetical protein [Verrucomicrobiota bacterium]